MAVLQVEDDVHQFVWSIHHVVIDGWCLSILLHELLDSYEAIRVGREPSWHPVRPFRDYVAWLNKQEQNRAEGFWKQTLRGISAATAFERIGPIAVPRNSAPQFIAERESLLPADLTGALHEFAKSRRLTMSTLMQGAWALLLSRYSGRPDVVFGVTVSGRPPEMSGVESMVGIFINVLPLRVAVNEESLLVPWLEQIQETLVSLRDFESVPLSRIEAWSEVPRGTPLVASIVTVQNLPFVNSLKQRAGRLGIESARYLEQTHYPLAVTVVPGAELSIKIAFDAGRFDSAAIDRAIGHLCNLLEQMARDPERRIVDLSLLTQSEQARLAPTSAHATDELLYHELGIDHLSAGELDALIAGLC